MNDGLSGLDRVMEAMATRPEPVEPLVRCVILGLFQRLNTVDAAVARRYYRQCRTNFGLTRASARRALAVQIVVALSNNDHDRCHECGQLNP